MSELDSPEFRRHAYDAAARVRQQEEEARAVEAQRVQDLAVKQQAAAQQRAEHLQLVNRERALGYELAQRAVAQHVQPNRIWVTHYRGKWDPLYRQIFLNDRRLAEGWMVLHRDTASEMDDGSPNLYAQELILTNTGILFSTGMSHSKDLHDVQQKHLEQIGHPKPKQYMREMMGDLAHPAPLRAFSIEEVRGGLAEFAGLNKLVRSP